MAGQDQSVNLGGMLTDIGSTIGSMGAPAGEVFGDAIAQANRPQGDMSDPTHLSALAQWATRNGDPESARMYESQAREARDQLKSQQNVQYAKDITGADDSSSLASQGNVEGLQSNIETLEQMAQEATTEAQINIANRALDNARRAMTTAKTVKVQNEINTLSNIDATMEQQELTEAQSAQLDKVRKGLMAKPEVREGYNAMLLAQWQTEDAERRMEAQQYLDAKRGDLQKALMNGNEDAVTAILDAAPNTSGRDSMMKLISTQREFNEEQAKIGRINNEATYKPNYDMLGKKLASLPEEAQSRSQMAIDRIRSADARRLSDGTFPTTADAQTYLDSLKAFDDALVAAEMQVGQQAYARSEAEAAATAGKIVDLENKRDNYEPSNTQILSTAEMMARKADDIVRDPLNKDRKAWNTQAYIKEAEAQLRRDNREDINRQLSSLRGEAVIEEEGTDVEALIQEGMDKKNITREEAVAFLIERGVINSDELSERDQLSEVVVPERSLRPTTPAKNPTSASSIYEGSIFTEAANAVGSGIDAVGGMLTERGNRAKEKLEANPYTGAS